MRVKYFCLVLVLSFVMPGNARVPARMALIPSGSYVPLYTKNKEEIFVREFWLDEEAVTNAQFWSLLRLTHNG